MIFAVVPFDLLGYKFGVKIVVVLVIPETNESLHVTHFVARKETGLAETRIILVLAVFDRILSDKLEDCGMMADFHAAD
jgi:hypothetical protein